MWIFCFIEYVFVYGILAQDNYNTNYNDVNYNNANFPKYNPNNVYTNAGYDIDERFKCPEYWVQFDQSCYRFIKSPLRPYSDAKRLCKAYTADLDAYNSETRGSDLVSIGSSEEHRFLIQQLNRVDPQHRRWYIGAYQQSSNYYVNPDGSQLSMENAFLDVNSYGKDYVAYNYSKELYNWGFEPVRGDESLMFICEANIVDVQRLVTEERTDTYGIDITDPLRIPKGPYFIKQPVDVTFDTFKRKLYNDVSLSCLAGGYPTPTYKWFREDYDNNKLVSTEINPLENSRYTISGGLLIMDNPKQRLDHATYHCEATNKFGTIISESVHLNFGFILEFVLKRSPEAGEQNWGKSVYCDPPSHFPSVKYSWSRNFFPNFVDEDQRVFVSNDGALYFSHLEDVDRANYSCSVQSEFSDSGRNGPFFPLRVNPHSNYQQLKFANNFPKVFPEAPIAGNDVRLECVAFGYPVPSYNWTRKGGKIPRDSYVTSYNRVLVIRNVQIEDEGEYICRTYNDRGSVENSVILSIQVEPNFTIPLTDKHMDSKSELVWTCEAFGVPDVNYTWWKNGKQLIVDNIEPEDRNRIKIQDNVLTISYLDEEKDPGMYQCRASNTLKTRFSSAQLRVLKFKPSFKKRPLESETYAAEGGNVTIKCNPEAAPRPQFTWKKDGNVIAAGGHRRIHENGDIFISPVSRDDAGIYTCTASNDLGVDESRGRLIVLRGPRLTRTLDPNIYTVTGANIDLECHAVTDEMLDVAYLWLHNGLRIRDIDVKNSDRRLKIDGGYFRILNTTFSDSGDYECVVKSAVGRIVSRTHIHVRGPPGPPGGVQVMNIEKTGFKLQWTDGATHGSRILSYTISGRNTWNSDWNNISHGVVSKEVDRYTHRVEADIGIRLMLWSTYEFRVAAWNEFGMGPPSAPSPRHSSPTDIPYIAPRNVGGGGGKIGDLTITWTPLRPEEQNAPNIFYKVYWKRKAEQIEFQSTSLKEFGNVGIAVVQIDTKYYYTEYVVKVQSLNDVGPGPVSEEVVIYSAEDMPQVAPQQVTVESYNSTALKVTWEPIEETREKVRGKLIGYRIKYWKEGISERDALFYLSRTTRPWALIVGLQPDTYYRVEVMAFNAAGEGPLSKLDRRERTLKMAPQKPPFSVKLEGINPSTIRVSWHYDQPSSLEEPIIGFKIRVWEFDQDLSMANDTIISLGKQLEGRVNNLSPGKRYKMRVLAYSRGGDGRMSSPELMFQMGDPRSFLSSANGIKLSFITLMFTLVIQFVLTLKT